jgi:hypothetical protein
MPGRQTATAEDAPPSAKSEYTKLVVEKDPFFAPILSVFESQRKLTEEMASALFCNFERFAEIQAEVASALMTGRPGDAFGFLSEILQVVNAAMVAQPALSAKMGGYLEKVKPMIGEIGRELGADGFTIEYGVPSGITVAFHFSVSESSNNRIQATR